MRIDGKFKNAFSVLLTGIFHKPTLFSVGALNYSVYLFALFINRVLFFSKTAEMI